MATIVGAINRLILLGYVRPVCRISLGFTKEEEILSLFGVFKKYFCKADLVALIILRVARLLQRCFIHGP